MTGLTLVNPDRIRRRAGLSRGQWTDLVGSHPDDETIYEVMRSHERFIQSIKAAIEYEMARPAVVIEGEPYISTIQAARALGVGEFHLANLRERNKLEATRYGRRSAFSRANLYKFLEGPEDPRERHSALATAFLRWWELQDQKRKRAASPSAEAVSQPA